MKTYVVMHCYDVDGGIGDAVSREDIVAIFSTREKAEEFVQKYKRPIVYEVSYTPLECGVLDIRDLTLDEEPPREDLWWLDEQSGILDDEDYLDEADESSDELLE